jgi:hypothetical protein
MKARPSTFTSISLLAMKLNMARSLRLCDSVAHPFAKIYKIYFFLIIFSLSSSTLIICLEVLLNNVTFV